MKTALYARHSIPEYWIVNLVEECVEVYPDPHPAAGRYRAALTFGRGGEVHSSAVPEALVQVDSLFA